MSVDEKNDPHVQELITWGCDSIMHIIHLTIDRLDGEDQYKDIDFSTQGIEARSQTGYNETTRAIESEIWSAKHDELEGIHIHTQFR
jgi:NTE family protein